MLSSVLNSEKAVQVNIAIMRAFLKLREILASHQDLARRLQELEAKYDSRFKVGNRSAETPTLYTCNDVGADLHGRPAGGS